MTTTSDSASFLIIYRDNKRKPDFIFPWNKAPTTYVVAAIKTCPGMLTDERVKAAFTTMGRDYSPHLPEPWYGGRDMSLMANEFIHPTLLRFPLVFVDDSITNPAFLVITYRRRWDTGFEPRDHAIGLHGSICGKQIHLRQLSARQPDHTSLENP